MNSDAKMICRSIDKLTDEVMKLRKIIQYQNARTAETYIGDNEEKCTKESPPI